MLHYVVFLTLVVIGLLLTLIQEKLGIGNAWHPYLSQISSSLLAGGVISILYKVFVDRHSDRNLKNLLRIHESINEAGLDEVLMDSRAYNFTEFLERADSVSVVLNDGLRWVGQYSVDLEKRFNRKGAVTEVFIVDPDGPFCLALAQKICMRMGDLSAKIRQTVSLLTATFERTSKLGVFRIYYLKNYPTHSVFASEDHVIITCYQISGGRRTVPLFVYRVNTNNRGYGCAVLHDLDCVRQESKVVFDSVAVVRSAATIATPVLANGDAPPPPAASSVRPKTMTPTVSIELPPVSTIKPPAENG